MTDSETDHCWKCDKPAGWTWWNGRGGVGRYCDEHARGELDPEDSLPSYSDPLTTSEDLSDRSGPVVVPGGGVRRLGGALPVIRSQEAFDQEVSARD